MTTKDKAAAVCKAMRGYVFSHQVACEKCDSSTDWAILVYHEISGGRTHYLRQCLECGVYWGWQDRGTWLDTNGNLNDMNYMSDPPDWYPLQN